MISKIFLTILPLTWGSAIYPTARPVPGFCGSSVWPSQNDTSGDDPDGPHFRLFYTHDCNFLFDPDSKKRLQSENLGGKTGLCYNIAGECRSTPAFCYISFKSGCTVWR